MHVVQSLFHECLLSFGICMQVFCFNFSSPASHIVIILVKKDSCDGGVAGDVGDKLRVVDHLAFSCDGIIVSHSCVG